MFETIIACLVAWAPSIVAILGVVGTIIAAFNVLGKHLAEAKATITELKGTKEWKEASTKLANLAAQNEELVRCNKLLLDQLTRIKGYADEKAKEEQTHQ